MLAGEGPYILKTYGRPVSDAEFDYLFGFLRSKDKKKKDRLEIQQKQADINLTVQKQAMAARQIEAETAKAQAEQIRAEAAKTQAEKAALQLQGAKLSNNLMYLGFALGGIVVLAGIAGVIYMVKQGKRSALIAAKLHKAKAAAAAAQG